MKNNKYLFAVIHIIISIIIIVFYAKVVVPFAEAGNFFSEGPGPTGDVHI